jgi:hypothetical protein
MPRSEIIVKNCQIKSLEKFRKVSKCLSIIEEEIGIKEVKITFENNFVCPWIEWEEWEKTPMEELLIELIDKIRK